MNKNNVIIKVIVADYYKEITDSLTLSATSQLKKNKIKYEIIKVPGVYEIPQMIKCNINSKFPNLFLYLIHF